MRMQVRSLASCNGLRIVVSCGGGHRCGSNPVWLWCRPAAIAPIGPLAWEPLYAAGAFLEKEKKNGHYLMVWSLVWSLIQEEDITIINIHTPNIGEPRYLQQILTDRKGEIDGNTIVVGDFNTLLTSMDRSSRQKTNKASEILKDTIETLDSINFFRTLHPKKSEYTCFSSAHGTFSKIDHILDTKLTSKNLRV